MLSLCYSFPHQAGFLLEKTQFAVQRKLVYHLPEDLFSPVAIGGSPQVTVEQLLKVYPAKDE